MKNWLMILGVGSCLVSCVNHTVDTKMNASRKTQIKEMCYQDVVVPKELLISLAEPAYGTNKDIVGDVSAKTKDEGTAVALRTITLYQKEIHDSMINQMRLYDVKFNHCSKAGSNSPYSLQFVIHRAFAERAPNRMYKTGVGVNVKIFEKGQTNAVWESEYVSGTEAALGDAEKAHVDGFAKKIVWQLYQSDWLEKR